MSYLYVFRFLVFLAINISTTIQSVKTKKDKQILNLEKMMIALYYRKQNRGIYMVSRYIYVKLRSNTLKRQGTYKFPPKH